MTANGNGDDAVVVVVEEEALFAVLYEGSGTKS